MVDSLNASRLADSGGLGGLKTVDLGSQLVRDLIDLSQIDEAVTIDLSTATPYVAASGDLSRKIVVKGVDQILGSDFDDDILGGAGGETISGRGGENVINGGAGADTIVVTGGNDLLTGGAGNDKFWFEIGQSNDFSIITDPQPGDRLYWHGYLLQGGPLTVVEHQVQGGSEIWDDWELVHLDSRGVRYIYDESAAACEIILPGGQTIKLEDFQNGDLGFSMGNKLFSQYRDVLNSHNDTQIESAKASLPKSNIVDNGQLYDYTNLTNYQASIATYGPISPPYDFFY